MTPDSIDAKNMSAMIQAMQTQIWILIGVVSIMVPLVGILIRVEWVSMRNLLEKHDGDIQKHKERWAKYDGSQDVALAVVDVGDKIAEAIEKKYVRK